MQCALFRFPNKIQWPHLLREHPPVIWPAFVYLRPKGYRRGKGNPNPEKLVSSTIVGELLDYAGNRGSNPPLYSIISPILWFSFGSDRVRVRKPWPGSPRIKESPNQSPKQQGPSTMDFAPSSPSYQHFPKQVKSPPSARRVPRKKSLKKTKVTTVSFVLDMNF